MYLKRLESVGFKSFAEKISVDFVPGVTAVVGPNGSGKSNVTDAIRWVLGEQSAKSLRGTKMEDIIFQGSDTRKALNMAEVTLTLNNESQSLPLDYKEISVTRRVYRSGDSEFYINKESCRLKDIVDLFLDSGLGREAFSIISQGKVEEILSSKAEERRSIFEEAAGVLKYKNRKKKAEFKLIETEDNLHRVEDILNEIETQREPLAEQASIAKDYLAKKKELKETELKLLRTDIANMHEDWKEMSQTLATLKDKRTAFSISLGKEETEIDNTQSEMESAEQTVQSLQQDLLRITELIEKKTGEKNVWLERKKYTRENKDKVEHERNQLKTTLAKLRTEVERETKKTDQLAEEREGIKQQLKEKEKQASLTTSDLDRSIENSKSDYIDLLNDVARLKHTMQSSTDQLKQLNERSIANKTQVHEQEARQLTLRDEVEQLQVSFKQEESVKTELNSAYEALKHDHEMLRTTLTDMYQKQQEANRTIDKLESRKDVLTEMKDSFQGFFQGVKAVLAARDKKEVAGVIGAVIELIDIPKAYMTAIETAIGGQAQHVIVETEKAAREAIAFLKTANAGRATFYPLESIRGRAVAPSYLTKLTQQTGFVAIAAEVITIDKRYQHVLDYLLGHTIIAKSLADANAIARLVDRKYRVVTLEGDIVNPGGSMTGGAQKKNGSSLFSRDQELQTLTEKLSAYHTRLNSFLSDISEKEDEQKKVEGKLATCEEKVNQHTQQLRQVEQAYHEKALTLKHQQQQLKNEQQTLNHLDQDKEAITKQLTEAKRDLATREAEIEQVKEKIAGLEDQRKNHQTISEKNKDAINQLKIQQATLEKSYAYQVEKRDDLKRSEANYLAEQKENEALYQTLIDDEEKAVSETLLSEEIASLTAEKTDVLKDIQSKREYRLQLQTLLQEKEDAYKLNRNKQQALIEQISMQEVKTNRLDVELENQLNYLQETYETSFERLKQSTAEIEDTETAKKRVKLIKKGIEELGIINLGAIDEFERINERFTFLTTQRDDLNEAKATLYAVINEMDKEMEKRFRSTFMAIKGEFEEVFRQLFGGGHAALELTDPTDLLKTGVEIKAQPPGKKAQQLALLSGGERALTAIALLFSILRVRPVPFCVLDEVEAALDEANVDRFSRYLKDYSQETQFIVITHRKGTMEGADVLYGVTMQESGVSRFVSVKLAETEALLES
ncbi:condensin subunit Smc [Streptohalobacillus salinus]|uniref:Chromosome partition protein Smc n=1 Tax=Streptohalobacillus salinus TaxID=621096 RepID=A0A2V3WGI5_9BACI|nr:chromosome segregation protein SMC [Streptohalobacillus salinus]PXW92557.1 condensin subunit Smc [Streptohalobacillus salinus]